MAGEPNGDWRVDVEDETPDYVTLSFSEYDEEGVFSHKICLFPENAREIADSLNKFADFVDSLK